MPFKGFYIENKKKNSPVNVQNVVEAFPAPAKEGTLLAEEK